MKHKLNYRLETLHIKVQVPKISVNSKAFFHKSTAMN